MNALRSLFAKNPAGFLASVFAALLVIHVFEPYKLVFLTVYFPPLLLTAYVLDLRRTLLSAFACALCVCALLLLGPWSYDVGGSALAPGLTVSLWTGAFLLTAFVAG